jgi:DNA-binding transcriptional ArsR family regulator
MKSKTVESSVIECTDEIEILSLDDDRLKILLEELSNKTSRSILKSITERKQTAGEIANSLNLSISLVVYHLERFLKTGLVKISNVKVNSKNRENKVYDSKKIAIIIKLNHDDFELKHRIRNLFIASTSIAVIGIIITVIQFTQPNVAFNDPDTPSFIIYATKYLPILLTGVITCIGTSLAIWFKRKFR